MSEPRIFKLTCYGFSCTVNADLGLLSVAHDGSITWDRLQAIKTAVWGAEVRAIEVYPAEDQIVNSKCERHLWRLGEGEFSPDLLGRVTDKRGTWADTLEARFARAWEEADNVFTQTPA